MPDTLWLMGPTNFRITKTKCINNTVLKIEDSEFQFEHLEPPIAIQTKCFTLMVMSSLQTDTPTQIQWPQINGARTIIWEGGRAKDREQFDIKVLLKVIPNNRNYRKR